MFLHKKHAFFRNYSILLTNTSCIFQFYRKIFLTKCSEKKSSITLLFDRGSMTFGALFFRLFSIEIFFNSNFCTKFLGKSVHNNKKKKNHHHQRPHQLIKSQWILDLDFGLSCFSSGPVQPQVN